MSARRALVALAGVVALLAAACGGDPPAHRLSGQVLTPPPSMASLSLPDQTGAPFSFRAPDADGLLVVYFGYTACPDVCPTTLSDVRTALKRVGSADADRVTLAMVTIDPERDKPSLLAQYVDSFVPGSVALSTRDADALKSVADAFGAIYKVTATPSGAPEVEHSAFLYALDADGTLRVQWPFGVKAKELADDLAALLDDIASRKKA